MRISGGTLAGRRIDCPGGVIRPAMDRMRESVFAVLGDLSGLSFLDLFSGSGIIALEAASRGASPVEAVESDSGKRAVILNNVSIAPCRINCRFMPAELYIKRAKPGMSFDVIFCDPPFDYEFKSELAVRIAESPLMREKTRLLIHHPHGPNFVWSGFVLRDRREYGRSVVDFLEKSRDR